MFEQLPAPNHVLAFGIKGKMTGKDIEQYKTQLDAKLGEHEQISILFDTTDLSDFDATAMGKGVEADLDLFRHLGQLGRFAFISDKEWPQALIGLAKPLLPTFEMKVFPPAERDNAMKWVEERPATPKAKTSGMRIIPTTRDDVLAFEINGVISSGEMPGVIKEIDTFLERHDKVRLLGRIKHLGGIDPSIFMQSGLISMKLAAMRKVERYAVVGAPEWMNKVVGTMNPMFPDIDMRTFPAEKEADAWAWLGAKQAE